ncbi:MAG: hypothetical protein WCP52_11310 [Bacteroidota bacterium]
MEAIIRTNDKNAFKSLIQFLKSMNFEVETKNTKQSVVKPTKEDNFSEAVKFWDSNAVNMSKFKLNREEAYER